LNEWKGEEVSIKRQYRFVLKGEARNRSDRLSSRRKERKKKGGRGGELKRILEKELTSTKKKVN